MADAAHALLEEYFDISDSVHIYRGRSASGMNTHFPYRLVNRLVGDAAGLAFPAGMDCPAGRYLHNCY